MSESDNPTMSPALNGQSRINGQLATNEADWSGTSALFGALRLAAGYYQEISANQPDWTADEIAGVVAYFDANPNVANVIPLGMDVETIVRAANTTNLSEIQGACLLAQQKGSGTVTTITSTFAWAKHTGTGTVGTVIGIDCQAVVEGGATINGNGVIGCQFLVTLSNAGSVNLARGCVGTISHTSAGVVTTAKAFEANVTNNHATGSISTGVGLDVIPESTAAGGIGTLYGVKVNNINGAGPVTTAYGLYVNTLARSGVTTTWGVYVVGDAVHFGANAEFTGSAAVIQIGGGATAATLRFMEPSASGTNYSEFKAQAQAGNVTYTFPAADGSNRQTMHTDGAGALSWAAVVLTTDVSGVLPVANGGTNSSTALNNSRIMVSSGGAIAEAAALTNGQLLIGSTGVAPVGAVITAGANIAVTNGAGSITVALTGIVPIANGGTNSSAALNNSRIMVSSAGAIVEAGAMTNGQLLIGSTGAAQVVATITAGTNIVITNGAGSITVGITGTIAIANGGTNSSTALNNSRIMVSSAGAIVEAAALTNGQLLIGSTGAAPVAAALTAGTGIAITNAAGSVTIAASSAVVRVLDRDVTEATVSNTVVETTVYSFTVPGGTLGSDRALHFMPMLTMTNNTGATQTITIRIKYGATTIYEGGLSATTNASARAIIPISPGCVISAANATNAQRSQCGFTLAAAGTAAGVGDTNDQNEFAVHNAIAIDSTVDQTLAVTVQLGAASASLSATFLPMQTMVL